MEEGAELFKLYWETMAVAEPPELDLLQWRGCECNACVSTCREHCRSLMAFRLPFQWSSWKTVISS